MNARIWKKFQEWESTRFVTYRLQIEPDGCNALITNTGAPEYHFDSFDDLERWLDAQLAEGGKGKRRKEKGRKVK